MSYDFDKVVDRRGTNCLKYDFAIQRGKPADVLPLWVADMDFPVAREITKALEKMVQHGIYGYSESGASYFQAVKNWMKKHHHWDVQEDWLIKTPGVVFAIAAAVRAFTGEGDAVMLQNPVYYPFQEVIRANGRVVVDNTLVEQDGHYSMDFVDLEQKIIANQAKIFLLCNPHNPVGRVWTGEELEQLGDICKRHGVSVISDEIHADFTYPGYEHQVFANLKEEFKDFTITCTAPSKTFNLAGLQVSNIFIANEKLRSGLKKEIEKTGYSQLNTAGILACEAAYLYGEDWLSQVKKYIAENAAFVREFVKEKLPGIKLIEPEGTYLIWLDCRGLGLEFDELEDLIVNKAGLWLDGGYIFGDSGRGFQRINIACPRVILREALDRLQKVIVGEEFN